MTEARFDQPKPPLTEVQKGYRQLLTHLPAVNAIGPNVVSLYRPEQPQQVLDALASGPVIISGPTRIGKSSLLNQVQGGVIRKPDTFGTALSIDASTIAHKSKEEAKDRIVRMAMHAGISATRVADVVHSLSVKNGVLLLDEFTHAVRDSEKPIGEPLVDLVNAALEKNIPTVLVIHTGIDYERNAKKHFPLLTNAPVIYPRNLTKAEVEAAFTTAVTWEAGGKPSTVSGIVVSPDAQEALTTIVGHKPITVNFFLDELFYHFIEGAVQMPEINPQLLNQQWQLHWTDMLIQKDSIGHGYAYALNKLQEIGQLDEFVRVFSIPSKKSQAYEAKDTVLRAPASHVSHDIRQYWVKLGLIVQEGNDITLDGFLPGLYITTHYQNLVNKKF